MTDVIETLKKARDLIAREGGWTQGAYARDAAGSACSIGANAQCFCTLGALRLASDGDRDLARAAAAALRDRHSMVWIDDWNDTPGRTQAEVVALFDAAIAAEEARNV